MTFVRFITKLVFYMGSILLLWFSVCVLGLCGYCVFKIVQGEQSPMPFQDLAIVPGVGLTVCFSSCYILVGKYPWLFFVSVGLLSLFIAGAFVLMVVGTMGVGTWWAGDELSMGLSIGSYGFFLLVGVLLKRRGFWDQPG